LSDLAHTVEDMATTTTLERPALFGEGLDNLSVDSVSFHSVAHLDLAVCRYCTDELEHCHESTVVHVIGDVHCTAADCPTPIELHHLVLACADLGCDCEPAIATAVQG
jgi:hypothetical protein